MTAYNWETNDSNAGSDWNYQNDDYLSSSAVAAKPMRDAVQAASDAGASIIMTVPMAGWVAADADGPCPSHPTQEQIAQRFLPILSTKPSAYAYPPDVTDGKVYADEFVHYLENQFPDAQTDPIRRIFYMLDNEPALWSSTHSEIHPSAVTHAELVQKSEDFAKAIKKAAPDALVFGPVSYGWQGYVDLQGAPDANNRDFLDVYLDAMKSAEQAAGKRLLDVLDVHWYPEAEGDGHRIVDDGVTAGEVAAREQAPRSLWDPTYTETSWITQGSTNGPIRLIPRLMDKIGAHYPGTRLSISEYNYGAGGHISGAIAQADVLGVFGREGVFTASVWLMSQTITFLFGAFAMYRNYDGQGGAFGDTSIRTTTSSVESCTATGSVDSGDPARVVVVAINKHASPLVAGITVKHTSLAAADVYALTEASATPTHTGNLAAVDANAFSYTMPAQSVTTIVFRP